MLSLPTDDTRDQTKRILLEMARDAGGEVDLTEWRDFQHWLAGAELRVVIPYAQQLAESIPPVAVRLRRDFRAVLNLIRTHAILHQGTRERDGKGRIIASPADYYRVRELVADLVADGVGATVSDTIRKTVEAIRGDNGVTVSAVAERLGIDRSAAQRRLSTARGRGFITNIEEKRGRPARYVTADPLPDEQVLLPVSLDQGVHAQQEARTPPCTPAEPLKTRDNSWGCAGVQVPQGVDREDPVADAQAGHAGDAGVACCHCRKPILPEDRVIERDDGELIHATCFRAALTRS
jgi:predicted transcriptional regulator